MSRFSLSSWVFALLVVMLGTGCDDAPNFDEQQSIDRMIIEEYIATNNLVGEFTDTGVFYSIDDPGVGTETPTVASTIQIIYTGTLLDGTVFDSSDGFPVSFPVFNLIRGWQIGLEFFKKESSGVMIIPSRLAYGTRGSFAIDPNTVIRFDIELLDFTN